MMHLSTMLRRASCALTSAAVLSVAPSASAAQVRLQDLVFTVGGSVERYSGNNFVSVPTPSVDSAKTVVAMVSEVGARGTLSLLATTMNTLSLSFDGGLRQTGALGFRTRDYAPREWVGSTTLRATQRLGSWGSASVRGGVRTRSVRDRPPLPLFLQPAYGVQQGSIGLVTRSFDGISLDAVADIEHADYSAPTFFPQLNLLDRKSSGVEVGARWGGASTVRFSSGVRWTDYRNQLSYDPADPFRRDRTVRVGLEWTYAGSVFAQAGVDGTLNRSNSNRPEYDAISFRTLLTAPLPADMSLSLYALITRKSYVAETSFSRLVPGEEADNASVAYLQLGRPLAVNLDGAIRFGWTRAETDFGNAYYQRFGGTIQFNFRPLGTP